MKDRLREGLREVRSTPARTIAVAALATALVLFALAVVLPFTGGDDDGGGGGGGEPTATATTPKRQAPRRPRRPALPAEPAVARTAPGAHQAPDESVPVLVYNVINEPRADTADPSVWVPPEEFRAQLSFLADSGYHAVTMSQVWAAWKRGGLLPSKPVVISFDTGYHSVYTNALPAMRERSFPGVLFLATAQLEADFPPSEVKELIKAGWELGAQPSGQGQITAATDEQLREAIGGTRRALRREFARRVDFFSYPGGTFDDRVAAAVDEAGFVGAMTLEEGLASPEEPPFELDRIQMLNGDGEEGLESKLAAAGAS